MRTVTLSIGIVLALASTGCSKDDPAPAKAENKSKPKVNAPAKVDARAVSLSTKPAPKSVRASLIESTGVAEVRRNGVWSPASKTGLLADDAVRTRDGTATVAIGKVKVIVEKGSEVTVRQLTDKLANLRLERGRLRADLADDGTTLRVRATGSSAVAEAKSGSFTIFNSGKGLVAVAARAGSVKLSSSGGDVQLEAGEKGKVTGTATPTKNKARRSILLSVVWPKEQTTRAATVKVAGKAEVGTSVSINGQTVAVSETGVFEARVPLKGGRNKLRVRARDLAGRSATRTRRINVNRRPPDVKAHTKDLWNKKKP